MYIACTRPNDISHNGDMIIIHRRDLNSRNIVTMLQVLQLHCRKSVLSCARCQGSRCFKSYAAEQSVVLERF